MAQVIRRLPKSQLKPVSCKTVPFTTELAKRLVEMKEGIWERPLRDRWISKIVTEMENGTFLWDHSCLAIAYCKWDKQYRRINGHHMSYARLRFNGRSNSKVRLTTYHVDTEEDLRTLYSHLDRAPGRTRNHIMNCKLVGTPEYEGVSASVMGKLASGYAAWKNPSGGSRDGASIDDVTDNLLSADYQLALHVLPYVNKIVCNPSMKALKKSVVFGAMFETFNKAVRDSDRFWGQVTSGLGFTSANDPAKKLRDYIQTHALNKKHSTNAIVVQNIDMYKACILAFNAFREGKRAR